MDLWTTVQEGPAYEDKIEVNWAPDFMGGTVVANEEVVDGKTERGGYPFTGYQWRSGSCDHEVCWSFA